MKKVFMALMAFAISSTLFAQKATIKGTTDFKEPPAKIYLYYSNAGERLTDSTDLKDGNFTFVANIDEPTLASIMARFPAKEGEVRPRVDRLQVYLEPGVIEVKVKDTLNNAVVSGSKANDAFMKIEKMTAPFNEKTNELGKQYSEYRKEKNKEGMDSIVAIFDKLQEEMNEAVYHKFLSDNPGSPVALYALERYAGYAIDPAKIEPIFKSLSEKVQQLPSGVSFNKRIQTAKKTAVGATALAFTQNDTLDKPVSLSDFKGKYVLLDFWASWCGPCRAENPNVVASFNKHKDENFTVLGVSLDQPGKKDAWMKAIHDDHLTWTHVSDLKFWDNAVAKEYGVRAIPQNYLIDPSGKIIAKNIRGEELEKKLEEVLN